MEVDEQIRVFREFIEQTSYAQLLEAVRKGETSLVLNFSELITFNTEICEEILERPEELLKAAELAVKEFDFSQKVTKFTVRFRHLPSSQKIMIGEIRSKHLNKFIVVEGIIRQKTDVRPHVTAAKFECPSCGNILHILQLDKKYKEPSRCGCGRKGKFKEISKELVDGQGLVLEEAPDALESSQPKRINVFLKDDLVSPISEKRCSPGSRVRLAGRVMEVPVTLRTGGQATKYDIILEANFIESLQEDAFEMQISEKEQQEIEELAKSPKVLDLLAESLAPSIYGHEKIKEALILQLVGGSRKERPDGIVTRGDIHVLLCGDPGSGKCLHPRTKIVCADGSIETIQEIVENNSVSVRTAEALTPAGHFEVTSLNQQGGLSPQPVSLFWKRPAPDILLKVKTASGSEIVVTENHPFFVTENGVVFSKQAHQLRNTDFIATPRTLPIVGKLQEIQTTILESKARNKRKITFPRVCDEGVARLLGYLVGDGYLAYSQTSGWVSLTNNDSLLLNDFKHLLEEKCNAKVTERRSHPGKLAKENYATSVELVRHFEQLEPTLLLKSAGKRVPRIICRSPNTIVKSFLRVLFDCEGSVHSKKGCIEISSASKDLIDDIKILLLRFGIISFRNVKEKCAANTQAKMKNPTTASGGVSNGLGFSSGKIPPIQTQSQGLASKHCFAGLHVGGAGCFSEIRRTYYELQIYGEHVDRFFTEIGFSSPKKMDVLSKICLQVKKHNTNTDVIPHVGEVLSLIRKQNSLFQKDLGVPRTTYMHYERGDRNPSRQNFQTVVKNLKSSVRELSVLTGLLDELAQAEIFWDKVEAVIPVPSDCAYVYDFQVEEVHNYVANAIVVHNSQILKRIVKVAPKARFTSGKGASAAGLTASVIKDEFLGGWSLEAGTLVLANRGFAIIDELDKMSKEDRSALHEALEQQQVSIAKANIQATLKCETTVLAAANPKFGRFDPYDLIASQIDLPPTLLNRFDLIFPIKDLPGREKDEKTASFILQLHKDPESATAPVSSELLKKYIGYARSKINPKMSDAAILEIKEYYISMRNAGGSEERGIRSVPITARQLEALVRLAEASAKVRLSKTVSKKDAQKAIELLDYCLNQIAKDSETGKIDIDRLSSTMTASQRGGIALVKEIISALEEQSQSKVIPVENVIEAAREKNISPEQVEEILEKLRRSGDIFEPKRGFVQRL